MSKNYLLIKSWIDILRLPNLFTLPGDIVAGYFLGLSMSDTYSIHTILYGVLISSLLYLSGMVLNDAADANYDKKNRPNRPIPMGGIKRIQAFIVGYILLISGIIVASHLNHNTFIVSTILAILIVLYNFWAKKYFIGSIIMGLCRGFNLLLGTSLVMHIENNNLYLILSAFLAITIYISAVTFLAKDETVKVPTTFQSWLPTIAMIIAFFVVYSTVIIFNNNLHNYNKLCMLAFSLFTLLQSARIAMFTGYISTELLPIVIGHHIRTLVLLQAFITVASNKESALIPAIVLLLLYNVVGFVKKYLYSS